MKIGDKIVSDGFDLAQWRKAINEAERNYNKKDQWNLYVGYGSFWHIEQIKAMREARKKTLYYKFGKVLQAWRILFKLIIRTYFKRNK